MKKVNKKSHTPAKPAGKAATPAAYLGKLKKDQRMALQNLRKNIKTAAPGLTECISYGLPGFRLQGKFLLAYGAAAKHCAFYPGSVLQKLPAKELKRYDVSKGTIRFTPDKPLPKSLVAKLVKLRVAQRAG